MDATNQFAIAARKFCHWAEEAPSSGELEMRIARRHLASLYALALDLPQDVYSDDEPADISHEMWQAMFKRFDVLPVNYYSHCFDPLEVPAGESTLGDLADDLADIWRDLRPGLDLFDAGQRDAATVEWRNGFAIHWGRHAASALYVLHCWAPVLGDAVASPSAISSR
jgi:hypothetical protein